MFIDTGWDVNDGIGRSVITGVGLILLVQNHNDLTANHIYSIFSKNSIKVNAALTNNELIQIFIGSKTIPHTV
ncbi:hypothetical protein CMU20_00015 [Elizabethkingia anophelis]|nr:hypothetical protein [Elizabethkingia anophelis]MDV3951619.1 hypothetical protein [Elizabethkingia anophelis]